MIANKACYGSTTGGGILAYLRFREAPDRPTGSKSCNVEPGVIRFRSGASVPVVPISLDDQSTGDENKVGPPSIEHEDLHFELDAALCKFTLQCNFDGCQPLRESALCPCLPHLLSSGFIEATLGSRCVQVLNSLLGFTGRRISEPFDALRHSSGRHEALLMACRTTKNSWPFGCSTYGRAARLAVGDYALARFGPSIRQVTLGRAVVALVGDSLAGQKESCAATLTGAMTTSRAPFRSTAYRLKFATAIYATLGSIIHARILPFIDTIAKYLTIAKTIAADRIRQLALMPDFEYPEPTASGSTLR